MRGKKVKMRHRFFELGTGHWFVLYGYQEGTEELDGDEYEWKSERRSWCHKQYLKGEDIGR
jgi:hypothetical protein